MYQTTRHRRPVPTDAHTGARTDFLHQHEAEARAAATGPGPARDRFFEALWARVADTRMLILAAEDVVRHGGAAPGVDGISPADLDRTDLVELAKELRRRLLDGTYRPAPSRSVEIPKGPGRGTRTLSLSVVADRVLERAVLLAVQDYVDPQLSPTTFGGRPGRSTAMALAAAERAAVTTGRWAWVTADVAKAFDAIPHDRLIETVRRWFGDTPTTRLIITLATAGRTVGVRQGGALSMMLLNVFLADHLDRPLSEGHPDWTLVRWVDDLLVLTPNTKEAHCALERVKQLLGAAGLNVKDTSTVTDLKGGDVTDWLGFRLGMDNNTLNTTIRSEAWEALSRSLHLTHTEDRPAQRAREIVRGWLTAHKVVTPNRSDVNTISDILRACELEDAINPTEMMSKWIEDHERHNRTKEHALQSDERINRPGQDTGQTDEPTASPVGTFLANHVPNAATDAAQSSTPDRADQQNDDRGAGEPHTSAAEKVPASVDGNGVIERPVRVTRRPRPVVAATCDPRAGRRPVAPPGSFALCRGLPPDGRTRRRDRNRRADARPPPRRANGPG